jgi:uncharacterized membrane protein YqiK
VLFDREGAILRYFRLQNGAYQEQAERRLWIAELQIGLGVWQGRFEDCPLQWLRWYDGSGRWIPCEAEKTGLERQAREQAERQAAQERLRAEQERLAKEQAEQRVEQEQKARLEAEQRAQAMAERLKALGFDPDPS